MLIEFFNSLLLGISIGFEAFLKALQVYDQLSSIKEQIIAGLFRVPVVVVSIAFLVPTIIHIVKRIIK